jgi:hypothetical protein
MPPLLNSKAVKGRRESVVDFVAREGIGRVASTGEQGAAFWFECKWCGQRFDKYQALRDHAREAYAWRQPK